MAEEILPCESGEEFDCQTCERFTYCDNILGNNDGGGGFEALDGDGFDDEDGPDDAEVSDDDLTIL